MFGIDGKAANFMKTISNMIVLNLLWVIGCLPIITIGPSTAAMVYVIRSWKVGQKDSVCRNYFRSLRSYIKTGWIVSAWFLVGFVLVLDTLFFLQMEGIVKLVLSSIIGVAIILFLLTTTFLIPIFVHFEIRGWELIKHSFVQAFIDGSTSFGVMLLWLAAGTMVYVMPVLMFFLVVPVFMLTFRFCLQSFEKFGNKVNLEVR
ncbi:YesL family protein [Halobacillus sp. Nhm2S1]|uniref:YesL family protein n=1 Tax=Halobacillus sp. Nhm2S1 TaxID=2866716 RepID=UPI001C73C54A|nr:DUF624 domain-containing protein [Halobacillus sp. Nhm2S1]MBX0357699.1 DUF624 domain-containing protein [Halobacillus sp. Nhm2S1]